MSTATEIITESMRTIGMLSAGEVPNADDAEMCRVALNTMLDGWNLPSFTLYTTTDGTASLSTGSLTIGPSQTINVTRPVRIEEGSYSRLDSIDYEMHGVSEAEFNQISLKSLGGFVPRVFWYDPGASTGTIYYWPVPTAAVVVHHPLLLQFSAFADLTTDYVLPQGYKRAIVFNLALEVAPHFGVAPTPFLGAQASNALRMVKRANAVVPQLESARRAVGVLEGFYSGYST